MTVDKAAFAGVLSRLAYTSHSVAVLAYKGLLPPKRLGCYRALQH